MKTIVVLVVCGLMSCYYKREITKDSYVVEIGIGDARTKRVRVDITYRQSPLTDSLDRRMRDELIRRELLMMHRDSIFLKYFQHGNRK